MKYNDKVKIIKGFYKGLTGVLVNGTEKLIYDEKLQRVSLHAIEYEVDLDVSPPRQVWMVAENVEEKK